MSTEENKAIVRRMIEVVNGLAQGGRDDGALDHLVSPEVARELREQTLPWSLRTMGPTHKAEIADMIADGDKVWVRVTTSGDHIGEWMGIPPSHRKWTNTGVEFCRLENGKVVELQGLFDVLNHITQLGATLTPPAVIVTAH